MEVANTKCHMVPSVKGGSSGPAFVALSNRFSSTSKDIFFTEALDVDLNDLTEPPYRREIVCLLYQRRGPVSVGCQPETRFPEREHLRGDSLLGSLGLDPAHSYRRQEQPSDYRM